MDSFIIGVFETLGYVGDIAPAAIMNFAAWWKMLIHPVKTIPVHVGDRGYTVLVHAEIVVDLNVLTLEAQAMAMERRIIGTQQIMTVILMIRINLYIINSILDIYIFCFE